MDPNPICAVIVTYHPGDDALNNLAAIRPQVQHLVVVDNGSTADELAAFRAAASTLNFDLLENHANLGLAAALNIGVRHAATLNATFVLLLDQDSAVDPTFTATMLHAFLATPPEQHLGILNPLYIDSRFGNVLEPFLGNGGMLQAAITSGSLMPLALFQHAGYFAEELFIDGIDYEYSFRIRTLGYTIQCHRQAVMRHSPGTPSYHTFLGSRPFQVANYSPIRRYYQERNKVWVTRRYWRRFYPFLLLQFRISLKDFIKILIAEDDKRTKISFFLRGIYDGFRERMGKYNPAP